MNGVLKVASPIMVTRLVEVSAEEIRVRTVPRSTLLLCDFALFDKFSDVYLFIMYSAPS